MKRKGHIQGQLGLEDYLPRWLLHLYSWFLSVLDVFSLYTCANSASRFPHVAWAFHSMVVSSSHMWQLASKRVLGIVASFSCCSLLVKAVPGLPSLRVEKHTLQLDGRVERSHCRITFGVGNVVVSICEK